MARNVRLPTVQTEDGVVLLRLYDIATGFMSGLEERLSATEARRLASRLNSAADEIERDDGVR